MHRPRQRARPPSALSSCAPMSLPPSLTTPSSQKTSQVAWPLGSLDFKFETRFNACIGQRNGHRSLQGKACDG